MLHTCDGCTRTTPTQTPTKAHELAHLIPHQWDQSDGTRAHLLSPLCAHIRDGGEAGIDAERGRPGRTDRQSGTCGPRRSGRTRTNTSEAERMCVDVVETTEILYESTAPSTTPTPLTNGRRATRSDRPLLRFSFRTATLHVFVDTARGMMDNVLHAANCAHVHQPASRTAPVTAAGTGRGRGRGGWWRANARRLTHARRQLADWPRPQCELAVRGATLVLLGCTN